MSQHPPAISIQGVSKAYRIWETPSGRLISPFLEKTASCFPAKSKPNQGLQDLAAKYYRDFWALKDISFELQKGESLGIIGRNGSGKSTLLQIIAGTLHPTTGTVQVNGRVAALLELGSGFSPEFTGRENIQLYGQIHGLNQAEISSHLDSILKFADIGDFIDQPIKTYSSGMHLRLAFAVQTAIIPDVLIVDEALAVGDAPFQAKCFDKIKKLQATGCTILLVSHDLGSIKTLCQKALFLDHGTQCSFDNAQITSSLYERACLRAMGMNIPDPSQLQPKEQPQNTEHSYNSPDPAIFHEQAKQDRVQNGPLVLTNFYLIDNNGNPTQTPAWDDNIRIRAHLTALQPYSGHIQLGIVVRTIQGQQVLTCADRSHQIQFDVSPSQSRVLELSTKLPLRAGKYVISTTLFTFLEESILSTGTFDFTKANASDNIPNAAIIEIAPQYNLGIYGPVQQESLLTILH